MKKRAHCDDVHESDEELRFFSQPPEPEPELSLSAPASLSPTWRDESEPPLSPHALARREARRDVMKRRVAWTLCGAIALLLLAAGARQRPRVASAPPTPPPVAATPNPNSIPIATSIPISTPSAVPSPPDIDATALITKARNLLHTGHTREGVAAARDALNQAPQEAEPYILLGAGLQDLGDYSGAREIFAACVQKANHGPSATCRYFSRF